MLLSLGNRSRDSSNNSDTHDEHCGAVEISTNLESPDRANNQKYDTLDGVSVADEEDQNSLFGGGFVGEIEIPNLERNSSQTGSPASFAATGSIDRNFAVASAVLPRLRSSTLSTEVDQPFLSEELLCASYTLVPNANLKRLRSDPLSEAKNSTSPATRKKMAVGGRFKSDSDDESSFVVEALPHQQRRFWVEPAENEAPDVVNSNPAIVASHINDDEEEISKTFAKENDHFGVSATSSDDTSEKLGFLHFLDALKKRGFEMIEQEGDGNCLFRAVSLQVYGSSDNHAEVRERCIDYMAQNEEHFSDFIAASSDDEMIIPHDKKYMSAFQAYIVRKRISGVHGNHTEIQALSELFNRPVEVYTPESCYEDNVILQPMNIFHEEYKTSDPPIRLSYHDGNHYNAIIDPLVPTAGLGLGLPGLKVGLADQMQITKAITESDQLADQVELERVIKESHDEVHDQTDKELQKILTESSQDFVRIHLFIYSLLLVSMTRLSYFFCG